MLRVGEKLKTQRQLLNTKIIVFMIFLEKNKMGKRENLKIAYLDISELKPYEDNPRINDNTVGYVANSIRYKKAG